MSPMVQWLAPSPLWSAFTPAAGGQANATAFRGPALLRFSSDSFMQDLQNLLATNPGSLTGYIAQPENWRVPNVGLSPATSTTASSSQEDTPTTLKLYQPTHARFYLVSASLVCALPGLPDHRVILNKGERTTFVLRRLQLKSKATVTAGSPFDPTQYDQFAWVVNATTAGWAAVSGPGLVQGEEQFPLFNMQFGSNGGRRRMFGGLIPVSRRQTYVAGRALQFPAQQPKTPPPPPVPAVADDPRKIDFQRQVLDPWVDLEDYYDNVISSSPAPTSDVLAQVNFGVLQGSAFILIDFNQFLHDNLLEVFNAVQNPSSASTLRPAQASLYQTLTSTVFQSAPGLSLATALQQMQQQYQNAFENEVLVEGSQPQPPSGYPGFRLTDSSLAPLLQRSGDATTPRQIQSLVEAALDEVGAAPSSNIPPLPIHPNNPQGDDWFVVQCVYQRSQCGRNAPPVLSQPSLPFQMASYFDPDAPARVVQVALPVDTSPAALRKYDKGVAFMISDQLGMQMSRVKGLQNLMNGDVGAPDGFGLGMICSLSIPIITICAFIVLFIFVLLLNIVFFWMPFLKICFPLPTFKAKGGS